MKAFEGALSMNFGNKIKTERKKLHLTQSELANKIGVSMRTVQSYEKGTCYPKQREIYQKLAKVFNCSVNYLLTESENFITQAEIRYGQR